MYNKCDQLLLWSWIFLLLCFENKSMILMTFIPLQAYPFSFQSSNYCSPGINPLTNYQKLCKGNIKQRALLQYHIESNWNECAHQVSVQL